MIRCNYLASSPSVRLTVSLAFYTCLLPSTGQLWDIFVKGIPQANFLSLLLYRSFSTINICHKGGGGLSGLEDEGQKKKTKQGREEGDFSGSSDTVCQVGGAIVFVLFCFEIILTQTRRLASLAPVGQ